MRDLKINIKVIYYCLSFAMQYFYEIVRLFAVARENVFLRNQNSLYQQQVENGKLPKPKATPKFRLLAVIMSKMHKDWKSLMVAFKPETVIRWSHRKYKSFWREKSIPGRPCISRQTIALIKRIHKDNPLLSPEKIHELLINLNITDAPAPNTIAKYFPVTRRPPSEKQLQSWLTFIKNHNLWSMDFFIIPTIKFQILHVLVIVSNARRKIEHIAVTANPNAIWTAQQIRNATPYGKQPKYLLHDNDPIFKSIYFQNFLSNSNIESIHTAYKSPWQNPIAERMVGIIRQNILNHIIPINEKHLSRILNEYVNDYYNSHRTHQGIGGQTPDKSPVLPETTCAETKLVSTPILGGLYRTYQKVA